MQPTFGLTEVAMRSLFVVVLIGVVACGAPVRPGDEEPLTTLDGGSDGSVVEPDAGDEVPDAGEDTPDAGDMTPDGGEEFDAGEDIPDGGDTTPDGGDEPDAGEDIPDAGEDIPDAGEEPTPECVTDEECVTLYDYTYECNPHGACERLPDNPGITARLDWPEEHGNLNLHWWVTEAGESLMPADCNSGTCMNGMDWGGTSNGIPIHFPDNNPVNDPRFIAYDAWGHGPEEVKHEYPFNQTYYIVARNYCSREVIDHNPAPVYSRTSMGPTNPIIRVYLDGVKIHTLTSPRPMNQRELWKAAVVTVQDGVITVTPSTEIKSGNDGCTRDTN